MKHLRLWLSFVALLFLMTTTVWAQTSETSANTVKYRVTYAPGTSVYTVWVVPQYSTPSSHNSSENEYGATAQVTIKVPADFNILAITDIKGTWDKTPIKLGDQPNFAPAGTSRYYTIGKSPEETNYGKFTAGEPVAIFSFTGSACAGAVEIMPYTDSFITKALTAYQLNIQGSFYSRSGQPAGGNVVPLEQYIGVDGKPAYCPPVATDDLLTGIKPGANAVVSILPNDKLSDSQVPELDSVTIAMSVVIGTGPNAVTYNSSVVGGKVVMEVPGEGTWTYDPATGELTFDPNVGFNINPTPITYRLTEKASELFDDAIVTVEYDKLPPVAANDTNAADPTDQAQLAKPGEPVVLAILSNDKLADESAATPTLADVDLDSTTVGSQHVLVVANEGTYTYNPATGELTFQALATFTSDPTPIVYTLIEKSTLLTSKATVTIYVNDPPVAVNDAYETDEDTKLVVNARGILLNDTDSDTPANLLKVVKMVSAPANGTATVNEDGSFEYMPNLDYNGTDTFTYFITDGVSNSDTATVTITIKPVDDILSVRPKVYLQGALYGVTTGSLMRDDLRTKGLLPTASPYAAWAPKQGKGAAAESVTSAAVFDATGDDNDIVDWVFVELRDATNPATVVFSRSALLQRDGDVVAVDGTSAVEFVAEEEGSYFVTIKHRNHLAVMTATAQALSPVATVVNFTLAGTPTYVKEANDAIHQSQVTVLQGKAMWAGNTLNDGKVVFQGTGNDVETIYNQIITATDNTEFKFPNYVLKGYHNGDVNMNGEVIFQGTKNDVEFIYQNVIKNHPGNTTPEINFVIQEQLPNN
ncbi:Ig-like domain-containing protein [Telluribacter sp. SYSU D00476]|uniref:Ig-like domain-containing protein n=1 Tax=Telluribacter sp. SYSU D00476 TaxID=2811430 RepID=UPI001FF52B1A|nr:Ig-like domain-containing protein [Telluribacter sp. SYSU D00476]